nr:MAG TPA: hypothetical protein [Caudoviricetes sp.]
MLMMYIFLYFYIFSFYLLTSGVHYAIIKTVEEEKPRRK